MTDKLPPLPDFGPIHTEPSGKVEMYPAAFRECLLDTWKRGARAAIAQAQSCVPAVIAEVIGCFRAAEVEGLHEALSETTDERLKDLIERRLMHALYACEAAASPQPQPVQPSDTQWQKRHPLRTDGAWENTNEPDAKWWRDNSQGWEIRVLYAAPVAQAKPERAAQPRHPSFEPFKCPVCQSTYFGPLWEGKEHVGRYCKGWPSSVDRSYHPCRGKHEERFPVTAAPQPKDCPC